MTTSSETQRNLVQVDDSVLVIIDLQDHFLDKYDRLKSQRVVANVTWLLRVADHLDVPVVAMAEDPDRSGGLTGLVQAALPTGTHVHAKDHFALVDNPEIMAALAATERSTAICVGTETDVCVAQSAIRLLNEDYGVVVLRDAVASMDADEAVGLARMERAGVVVSSVKALYYEWLRSVSMLLALRAADPELEATRPDTLAL